MEKKRVDLVDGGAVLTLNRDELKILEEVFQTAYTFNLLGRCKTDDKKSIYYGVLERQRKDVARFETTFGLNGEGE